MAEKEKSDKKAFAVFQQEAGSFTLGDTRLTPLTAVEIPAEVAAAADPDVSPDTPVRFFTSIEKANENVAQLRDKFARKPKK